MTCPKAKLLAGSLMCPCHGLSRTTNKAPRKRAPSTAYDFARRSAAIRRGQAESVAREGDLMAEMLVQLLTNIARNVGAASHHKPKGNAAQ